LSSTSSKGNDLRTSGILTENTHIRLEALIHLHKLGFKLEPLSLNNVEVIPWTPIYEDPNYWSEEKLITRSPMIKNIATVFGKTYVKDSEGKDLY
jgi:hypothetical protein